MTTIAETATLRGGYTMSTLDRLAAVAARRHGGATDYADRYDAAWFGIVNELYSAPAEPTERGLLFAGIAAVQAAVHERRQAHGASHRHDYEFGSAPAFGKFWNHSLTAPSPEEPVTERLALAQALATLTPEQYEALAAAAVCATQTEAAAALGLTTAVFLRRYYAARDQIRTIWFEGETPRRPIVTADACKSGHAKSTHQKVGPSGHRYCGECQRLAKQRRRNRTKESR